MRLSPLVSSAGLLALVLTGLATSAAADTVDELLARIRQGGGRGGRGGGGDLFAQLASFKNRASLEALQKAVRVPNRPESLDQAYVAFEHYRGLDGLAEDAVEFLVDETKGAEGWRARAAALGLARFGTDARDELTTVARRSDDAVVRARAIEPLVDVLAREGERDGLELLFTAGMPGHSGSEATLGAAFDQFTGRDALAVFEDRLDDDDASAVLRAVAVASLGRRPEGDQEVDQALVAALGARNGTVVMAALDALDARHSTAHARALSKLVKSKSPEVRRRAILAQGRLMGGDESWPRKLERLAGSSDAATRQGAVLALADLRTTAALELLYDELLADEDRAVRAEALQQIGNLRRKDSIPLLIARVNAERGQLRLDVLGMLRLVTGEDHGQTYERWKRWWDSEGAAYELPAYEEALAAERGRQRAVGQGQTVTGFYGLELVSDRIAFVLDVSGSMGEGGRGRRGGGGGRSKIEAAKEELAKFLEQYPGGQLFNLIFFASDVYPWQDELVEMTGKTRAEALKYVGRQGAAGATAVYDGLQQAFLDERVDTIVLLTDGRPEMGTTDDPVEIRAEVRRWNSVRHVRIHCLSMGRDSRLLRDLAEDSGGDYREVR